MHILPRLIIILFFILSSGCNIYKPVDARKVSPTGTERAKKNIEEGRGFRLDSAIKGNKKVEISFLQVPMNFGELLLTQ